MADTNKLPTLQREILDKFLKPLNPNISETCLLNVLNAKLAQMVTFKRVKFRELEFEKEKVLNYYALNFISSGGGKDKIVSEIDDYLLPDFKKYFYSKNSDYIQKQIQFLEQEAMTMFNNDSKQKSYVEAEKKKIRNLRFELEQATSEGLFADCTTLNQAGYGSIFVKISELGLFLDNPTQAQQLFLTDLLKVYDGKASLKSTKGESQSLEVEGIPCNILAYSDTNKLLQDKAGGYLNKLLSTGLVRRAFITYMPDQKLKIEPDFRKVMKIKNEAYKQVRGLKEEIIRRFNLINNDSVYQLTEEAYEVYYSYKSANEQKYNNNLSKSDDILLKEVRNRFWKALKLAGLIACLEHPMDTNIYPQDMESAIYQTELFAEDFNKFFKAKPETDTEKLFKFLLEHKEGVSKQEIRKQKFVNNTIFAKWFTEQLEYINEIASLQGYTLKEEAYHNGLGMKYKLVKSILGTELSPNVIPLKDLIAS